MGFESPTAAAYHVTKHEKELPPELRGKGGPVKNYAAVAMNTIKTGHIVEAKLLPSESTRLVIRKAYGDSPTQRLLEAIIYVKPGDSVVLASYGSEGAKI